MTYIKVKCNFCDNIFDEDDLPIDTKDDQEYCPHCKFKGGLMDKPFCSTCKNVFNGTPYKEDTCPDCLVKMSI